jgi:sugar lactone lactonase YvrE
MKAKLIDSVAVSNRLGEGLVWDVPTNKVWWTDILAKKLYAYDLEARAVTAWDTPEQLACFAFVEGEDFLLAGFESGFAYFWHETGELKWIKRLEDDNSNSRLNDGRTDRQGRFWVGTMAMDGGASGKLGALYSLTEPREIVEHISAIEIPNSLCWSPDSKFVYHCDTPQQLIKRYDFNSTDGTLSAPVDLIHTDEGCYPDGSIVDADGFLLNAQWGGSKVVRYGPDGRVDDELILPVSQPTCVAIGGPCMNLLFVTSANEGLNTPEFEAGNMFIFETDLRGLVESRYCANGDEIITS